MAVHERVNAFCARFGLKRPVLLAPMAGASAPALSAAVIEAGGMGALGALLMQPHEIAAWTAAVRRAADDPIQLNLWIPDPPPSRDPEAEADVRAFLRGWWLAHSPRQPASCCGAQSCQPALTPRR